MFHLLVALEVMPKGHDRQYNDIHIHRQRTFHMEICHYISFYVPYRARKPFGLFVACVVMLSILGMPFGELKVGKCALSYLTEVLSGFYLKK